MGMRKLLGAVLLAGLAASAQASEWSERRQVIEDAREAMYSHDFAKLEQVWLKYGDLAQKTASGVGKIRFVDEGIWEIMTKSAGDEAFYQKWDDLTAQWVKAHPDRPLAYIMRATVLLYFAYYYRGDWDERHVPPQALALYKAKAKQAADVLKSGADIAAKDAGWYVQLLDAGHALGWPRQVLRGISEEGLKKFPQDDRIADSTIAYLLPGRGGSAREVDAFVKRAIKLVPVDQRAERYSTLYSQVYVSGYGSRLYVDSLVDWKMMKQGLMDQQRRYPTSWNKNILARNACLAMDKKTTAELLDGFVPAGEDAFAWGTSDLSMFDTCKRWALSRD